MTYVLIGSQGYEDTWVVATSESKSLLESLCDKLNPNPPWDGSGAWQAGYDVEEVPTITTWEEVEAFKDDGTW